MKKFTLVGKDATLAEKIIFYVTYITMLFAFVFAIYHLITAPSVRLPDSPHLKIKSDYILMLIQCIAALIVLLLPSILEHKLRINIPSFMNILFILFLYAAVYLGEFRSFYFKFADWDTMLHTFSGMMLGAASFSIISAFTQSKKIILNPFFVALFTFCFAVTIGVVWEFYEFTWDTFATLNMQKYALEDGTLLIGRAALMDTMMDLFVDAFGALIVAIVGLISLKYNKGWVEKLTITSAGMDNVDDAKTSNPMPNTEETLSDSAQSSENIHHDGDDLQKDESFEK